MFEVGQSRITRLQAHEAILHSTAYDLHSTIDEPRKSPSRRRGLSFLKSRRARIAAGLFAAVLAIVAIEETARRTGSSEFERVARFLGFGIDQVTLVGHRFSYDGDVFDALDLANVRTFAALDTEAVKSRIERLPWIDQVEITRLFPGRLEIRVTERKPYAVWSRTDRRYLIDKEGRVLAAVTGDQLPDLPRFAGEGAALEAAGLMEMIARYPGVAMRLVEAERVSERRWSLKLSNETTLELPPDGEVGALEKLAADDALSRVVAAGRVTIDFRGPGRVAIRPQIQPATASAEPRTGS